MEDNVFDGQVLSALIDYTGQDRRSSDGPAEPMAARQQREAQACACHTIRKVALVGGIGLGALLLAKAMR